MLIHSNIFFLTCSSGLTVFEAQKKRPGDKRKRASNYDPSDLDNFTGPWAKFKDEKEVAVPTEVDLALDHNI